MHIRQVALVALPLFGCAKPAGPERFPITFSARSDGEALAGVKLSLASQALGVTAADGTLAIVLRGNEGDMVPVHAECPTGYRQPTDRSVVQLRRFRGLDPTEAAQGVQIAIDCPPAERKAVLVVRTAQANLPIMAQGRVLGTTDASGVAHAQISMPPNTTFRVVVDTTARPTLKPQNPATTLTLGDADEIFVVDNEFSAHAKPTPPHTHHVVKPVDTRPVQIK